MNNVTERAKPGPQPKGYKRQHIFIPPDLAEWAKGKDGGLSGLVRRLLTAEYERGQRGSRRSSHAEEDSLSSDAPQRSKPWVNYQP